MTAICRADGRWGLGVLDYFTACLVKIVSALKLQIAYITEDLHFGHNVLLLSCIMFQSQFYLFFGCDVSKYVIYSNHLGKNGATAERVAQCSQPGGDIAQYSHYLWISSGNDIKIDINV